MADFVVVLVEPKYEGNVGSVARVMKNFGFSELVIVSSSRHPKESSEARAMAMHGRDVLNKAVMVKSFQELKDLFDYLVATSSIVGSDTNSWRNPVFPEDLVNAFNASGKVGLVFGREDYGLSNEEILACDLSVTIPANPDYPTLNLSHSVAVILYELSRVGMRSRFRRMRKMRRMSRVEKQHLLGKFDAVVECVYDSDFEVRVAKKTFRNIVGRAFVSGREAGTLTGLFRHVMRHIKKS